MISIITDSIALGCILLGIVGIMYVLHKLQKEVRYGYQLFHGRFDNRLMRIEYRIETYLKSKNIDLTEEEG